MKRSKKNETPKVVQPTKPTINANVHISKDSVVSWEYADLMSRTRWGTGVGDTRFVHLVVDDNAVITVFCTQAQANKLLKKGCYCG